MFTQTTTLLLESLKDSSKNEVWSQFDARFRPIIIGFAIRLGLHESDAEEVAQLTLAQFASDYAKGRYERGKGRLSSWIIGIARNRIADMGREESRRKRWRGESAMVDIRNETVCEQTWRESQQRAVLREAMEILREKTRLERRTIEAFELTAVQLMSAEEAAAKTGLSVGEVYVAKNRVIKKLREIVAELGAAYEDAG